MKNKSESLSQIIEEILTEFKSNSVNYCILRNYELFPESYNGSGDIDILILNNDFEKVKAVLEQHHFIRFRGAIQGHVQFVLYVKKVRKFILVDLYIDGLSYGGILYLHGKQILNRKQKFSSFFIPSKEDVLITLLLHAIIDKGFFKQEHINTIETLIDNNIDFKYIDDTVSSLFGEKIALKLLSLLKNRAYNINIRLRIYLLLQRVLRAPRNMLFFTKFIVTTRLRKILNLKRGCIIAIIGVDGSGKSTVAEKLKSILREGDFKATVVYMGWKDNFVLPLVGFITEVYSKIEKSKKHENHKSYKSKISDNVISLAKEIICFIEFVARYIVRIYPPKRLGYVILTDRYIYDRVILDNKINIVMKWIILHLFPKPNFIFYLDNDPITLLNRKNEISIDEITQQRIFFEKYEKIVGYEKIWTEQDADEICDYIINRTWKEAVELI